VNGSATVLFEILERVDEGDHDDETAIRHHLEDIFEESEYKLWQNIKLDPSAVPNVAKDVPVYKVLITTPPSAQGRNITFGTLQFVALACVIIRFEKQKADLLITVNMPHTQQEAEAERTVCKPGLESQVGIPEGKLWDGEGMGEPMSDCIRAVDEAARTFKIVDWSLFEPDVEMDDEAEMIDGPV